MLMKENAEILFGLLCLLEAIRRARVAQQEAYENAALDLFERKLANLCTTTRCSVLGQPLQHYYEQHTPYYHHQQQQQHFQQLDKELARKALRRWIPVIMTLFFWCALLPPSLLGGTGTTNAHFDHKAWGKNHHQHYATNHTCTGCQKDTAILSLLLSTFLVQTRRLHKMLYRHALSLAWHNALRHALFHPRRFLSRIRKVSQWIKWIRFAGPLLRMMDKIRTHLLDLLETWHQTQRARAAKLSATRRRSLLRDNLERIASLERFQSALRSFKSRVFHQWGSSSLQRVLKDKVGNILDSERAVRKGFSKRITTLRQQLIRSSSTALGDVYDQLVDLTQDMNNDNTHTNNNNGNGVHAERKQDGMAASRNSFFSSLFFSKHLMAPNTRLCIAWRVVVSVCLVLELARLAWSWNVDGNFAMPLGEMIRQVAHHWTTTTMSFLTFLIQRILSSSSSSKPGNHGDKPLFWRRLRSFLSRHVLRNGREQSQHASKSTQGSKAATTILETVAAIMIAPDTMGRTMEHFMHLVFFLDIFVWFFTGEINEDMIVVPKPFFSRCIIPGTLVQVFDHPTLPTLLPTLFSQVIEVAHVVGLGRMMRWLLVLEPVLWSMFLEPLMVHYLLKQQYPPSSQKQLYESFNGINQNFGSSIVYSASFVY